MNIPDSIPALLAVLALAYWPVTAAILLACAVLAFVLRTPGLRIACGVVAAVVIVNVLGGMLWLWG